MPASRTAGWPLCLKERGEATGGVWVTRSHECKTIANWPCGVSSTRMPTYYTKYHSKGVAYQKGRFVPAIRRRSSNRACSINQVRPLHDTLTVSSLRSSNSSPFHSHT